MGNALIFGKDGPACIAWLRKAHRQHPSDALISFDLSFHLSQSPSADTAEALRFAEAALRNLADAADMTALPVHPAPQTRKLIIKMARENNWGYSRILGDGSRFQARLLNETGAATWDEFLKQHASSLCMLRMVVRFTDLMPSFFSS